LTSAKQQIPVGGYDSVRLEISNVTWVFNRTTTRLSVQSSQVETILDFTAQAGRETTITLVLSGHMEEVGGTQLFASNLTATLGEVTGP
jgi:glucokinase